MTEVIEKVELIFADIIANHNKYWSATLYDNGDCLTEWGRVGYSLQSASFPGKGKKFFDSKVKEKLAKGYTRLKTIGDYTVQTPVTSALHEVAKKEILKTNDPILTRLIDQLVRANIHQIVSNTKITYNSSTGLFTTPLGIVTLDAIQEARNYLDIIGDCLKSGNCNNIDRAVSSYLRLIPSNVGMKMSVNSVFPNMDAVSRQSNILDSLEASYAAVTAAPPTPLQPKVNMPTVFKVDVDVLRDTKEIQRITQWFEGSKRSIHHYDHVHIQQIYSVDIHEVTERYNKNLLSNTHEVFHGSSCANLLSILKSGLKIAPPSTARQAGAMMGRGLYGATNSTKSLGYCYNRWGQGSSGDKGYLFVADFKMGKHYETFGAINGAPNGYDSVWAKAGKSLYHDELVVYNESQVKLKFLIECS